VELLVRTFARAHKRLAVGALLATLTFLIALVTARATRDEHGLAYVSWSAAGVAALLVPGLVAVVVALESFRRRGIERGAFLLALAGLASLLPELGIAGARPSLAFTAGLVLAWSMPPLVAHLALIYPDRRLGLGERMLAAVGYAATIGALGLMPALVFDPVEAGCGECARNLVLLGTSMRLETPLFRVGIAVSLAWAILAVVAILLRLARATSAGRRLSAPVLLPAAALVSSFVAELALSLGRGFLATDTTGRRLWLVGQLALLAIAFGIAARWMLARRARALLARDVVELSSGAELDTVAERLARMLGDPALEVGYAVGAAGGLVDIAGNLLAPSLGPGRTTTVLYGAEGEPLAVLRHREGLLGDPALVDEITHAAGLALANERLRAETRAQLVELQASRARIVEAADAERRRLERDLHDGAQQRIVSLAVALRAARGGNSDSPLFDEAQGELASALDELRSIARGIHPAVLSDSGLAAAVVALAETARIPLEIGPLPVERVGRLAEATAYFVVAEAARNAAAGRLAVSAVARGGVLSLTIATDAFAVDLTRFSDRVGAVGGTIRRRALANGQVELEVTIPCGS
jgi:signal transduction histidine kinase